MGLLSNPYLNQTWVPLSGNCSPNHNWALHVFVRYLKIVNTFFFFFKNNVIILKKIVWETQK